MKRLFLLLALCVVFLMPWSAFAQADSAVELTAEVSTFTPSVDEAFLLTVTMKQKNDGRRITVGDLQYPDLAAFSQTGSSNSSYFNFSGGATQSVSEFERSLVPLQEGSVTIGPVSVTYKDFRGEEFLVQTEPLQITVGEKAAVKQEGSTARADARDNGVNSTEQSPRKRGYGIEVAAVVLLGALMYGLYYKKKKGREEHGVPKDVGKKVTQLPALSSETFFDDVASTVKEHLVKQYDIDAKQSTREFLSALKEKSLVHSHEIEEILGACDRARFAKEEAPKQQLLEKAKKIIG